MNKSALSLTAALTIQSGCTPTPPAPTPVITVDIPAPPVEIPTYQEKAVLPETFSPESASKLTSEMMAEIRWKCQQATPYLACSHDENALFFQIQRKYPITVNNCKEGNDWDLNCADDLFRNSYISTDQTVELYTLIRTQCSYMFHKCVSDELSRGTEW